jgi:lipopolysaccharide export system protein LptA
MMMTLRTLYFALLLSFLPTASSAQAPDLDLRLPWNINSETMAFDGKTSTVIYTGLRFSQGNIFIEADEGRSTVNEKHDGSWSFSGNVIIDVNNGRIECKSAELAFAGNVLKTATVFGSPATFAMQRANSDDTTHAQAGKLFYDVQNGVIEFSEQATITESGNEISSNYLVYNINERRINADSSGEDNDRVRITYTPSDTDTETETENNAEDTESP